MEMERSAAELISTDALPLVVQPPVVITMPMEIVPVAPALNVIDVVPWPPVIVPLVTVQLYVPPVIGATVAVLPLEFGCTLAGAAIVVVPVPPRFTVVVAVAVHDPFETVTE